MTQNTLSEEIERVVEEFDKQFVSYMDDGKPVYGEIHNEQKNYLRQSLTSIAEKTVEAVRVEKNHLFYPIGDETSWMNKGWDKAVTEQSKLASQWLGKEEV